MEKQWKTSDFDFELPEELIAQTPPQRRDASRMLVLERESGRMFHRKFSDLLEYIKPADGMVFNDSRVMPARLIGVRRDTGYPVEFLLLENRDGDVWETLVRPGRKCRPGTQIVFGGGELSAEVTHILEDGSRLVRFHYSGVFNEILDRLGSMPLPPYIHEKLPDPERYQTVYSKEPGSAAAPTAGLHFTPETLCALENIGVLSVFITLHVGLGTFRPVKVQDIKQHHMHTEHYRITQDAANTINSVRERRGRIICVGTTSCRTLESASDENGKVYARTDETGIFIYPGYKIRACDGLLTNFHLPQSTLMMLVSAFAGYDQVMNAYRTAVEERYRFFSFGDCMLII